MIQLPSFDAIQATLVPPDADRIETLAYHAGSGRGGARYVHDAAVDSAYVAAHPLSAALSADGQGFRLDLSDEPGTVHVDRVGARADGVWSGSLWTGTDDTPSFRAADAVPDVRTIAAGPGNYMVAVGTGNACVLLANANRLRGAGDGVTFLRSVPAALGAQAVPSSTVATTPGRPDIRLSDVTIDVQRSGSGGEASDRRNAIAVHGADRLTIERITAENAVGYSFFPSACEHVIIRDCRSFNSQVHFEPIGCRDVLESNCHARSGPEGVRDGGSEVFCEAGFHSYDLIDRLTIESCSHIGPGFGLYPATNVGGMTAIWVTNSLFRNTTDSPAAYIGGASPTSGRIATLRLSGCTFEAAGTGAATIEYCDDAILVGNVFKGAGVGLNIQGTSTVYALNNLIDAVAASAGTAAVGLIVSDPASVVRVGGGRLKAVSTNPINAAPYSVGKITIGPDVELSPLPRPSGTPLAVINQANTTVTPAGATGFYTVKKTAGGIGWNASARSAPSLAADFLIEIIVRTVGVAVIGVSTNPAASVAQSVLAGVQIDGSRMIYAVEGGASPTSELRGVAGNGDRIFLRRSGTAFSYIIGPTPDARPNRVIALVGTVGFDCSIFVETVEFDVRVLAY